MIGSLPPAGVRQRVFTPAALTPLGAMSTLLPMQSQSEAILLELARSGQERAFSQLVDAHSEKAIGLALRLTGQRDTAEEIAQEAFLRLFKSLDSFRGDSSIGTWLYRTVTRLAIDHLRREKIKRRIFFLRSTEAGQADPLELAPDTSASPHDILQARETAAQIQRVIDQLPARQKAIFVLRQQEGLPLKEIAAMLGLELGTVKAHLHRAVKRLRQEFPSEKES